MLWAFSCPQTHPREQQKTRGSTLSKTCCFLSPTSTSLRAPIWHASPLPAIIPSSVTSNNSTDAHCAGASSTLRMRVSRSGLRQTSTKRHQARSVSSSRDLLSAILQSDLFSSFYLLPILL